MASSYRTLNLDVLTVKTILVKSATNSNIPINTVLASDGRGGTSWRNPNILFASSLSTISSITYQLTYGLSTITYPGYGLSSLSSIVSYGLSSILGGPIGDVTNTGVSSLSSIISYGLSSINAGAENPGVSSLSSIVSYGLSSVSAGAQNPGVSSLSSIISYGLSSVSAGAQNPGVSTLSSIISYGLSSVQTINITCNITNTQVGGTQCNITNNYINSNSTGISSLSSIVSYGLSTVYSPYGISSLSSIVSYGLSSLGAGGGEGISSLSSIVSYGLSSLGAGGGEGISSLSSIVSYGLSSLGAGGSTGISSLSSIVSYGLSSFSLNSIPFKSIIYNSGTNINFTNGQINPSVNTVYGFSVYSCAYGNNLWVIGGAVNQSTPYGLMYSLNGINWNNCSFASGFTPDYTNNIKYIESNFVGITKVGAAWYIIWSSNGINWNRNTTNFTKQVFDYAYNNINNRWEFVLAPTSSAAPLTSIKIASNILAGSMNTPTDILSGGFTTNGCGIAYNSNIWVAVGINSNGFSNVQYSINGTNWSNASNVTYKSSSNILRTTAGFGATSVVYVAPNWYVAGAGGTSNNPIYRSSDGRNYSAIATSNTSNINIVLSLIYDSNSSQFYSLANINNLSGYSGNYLISSANNCSNWSVISPFTYSDTKQIGLAAGVITPPVQTTAVFASNIYANTVNAEYLTGDGNGLTNLNVSALSNSLAANIGTNTANIATNTTNIINVSNFFTAYLCSLPPNVPAGDSNKSLTTSFANSLILSNIFGFGTVTQPIVGGIYMVSLKFTRSTRIGVVSIFNSNTEPYIYISQNVSNLSPGSGALTLEYIQGTGINYNNNVAFYPVNTIFQSHQFTGVFTALCNLPFNLYWTERNPNADYNINVNFNDIILQRIA